MFSGSSSSSGRKERNSSGALEPLFYSPRKLRLVCGYFHHHSWGTDVRIREEQGVRPLSSVEECGEEEEEGALMQLGRHGGAEIREYRSRSKCPFDGGALLFSLAKSKGEFMGFLCPITMDGTWVWGIRITHSSRITDGIMCGRLLRNMNYKCNWGVL